MARGRRERLNDVIVFSGKSPSLWHRLRRAALLALACTVAGCAAPAPQDADAPALVYVGSRTGHGLQALRFDARSGRLSALGRVADVAVPRWLVGHPRLPVLYAASDDGAGRLIAFAVDRGTGALARTGEVPTGGNGPTYLWLDRPSMTMLVAHYGSGSVASIALRADGGLGAVTASVPFSGSGPNRRQASSHAHGVVVAPGGRFALVPDLGADRVFVQRLEPGRQALAPVESPAANAAHAWVAPPGSGPRHLVFGRDGRFAYLVSELTAEVTVLRWDAQAGRLALVQTLPLSSPGFQGARSGSEIALGADGRTLYVGNRGESSVLVYRVDTQSGRLSLVQRAASGGAGPWTFALHPSGRWLFVANERSNTLNVLRVDPRTGALSDTGVAAPVPAPISIAVLE